MPRPRFAAVLAVAIAASLRSTVLLGQDGGAAPSIHAVGFDCATTPRPPIAELVCGTPALTQADFALAQVYYALRQQVGQAAWPTLRQEYLHALDAVRQTCAVPRTGALPPAADQMIECVQREYGQRRSAWLSRLTGAAAQEAQRSAQDQIALQRRLQQLGYLPPTEVIDGLYGSATRAAIVAWQRSRNLPVTGFLGDRDALGLLRADEEQQAATSPESRIAADMEAAKLADAALDGDEAALRRLMDGAAAKMPSDIYGLGRYYSGKLTQLVEVPGVYMDELLDEYEIKHVPGMVEAMNNIREFRATSHRPIDKDARNIGQKIILYWQEAARQGDPAAETELGMEYWGEAGRQMSFAEFALSGLGSDAVDPNWILTPNNAAFLAALRWACDQAVHWLNLSNDQNWPKAAFELAMIHSAFAVKNASTETGCLRPNPELSDQMLVKAARLSEPDAVFTLARKRQEEGRYSEARDWIARLRELAASGDKEATGLLQHIAP